MSATPSHKAASQSIAAVIGAFATEWAGSLPDGDIEPVRTRIRQKLDSGGFNATQEVTARAKLLALDLRQGVKPPRPTLSASAPKRPRQKNSGATAEQRTTTKALKELTK